MKRALGLVACAGLGCGVAYADGPFAGTATLLDLGNDGAPAVFAYGIDPSGSIAGTLRAGSIAAAFRWTDANGLEVLERLGFSVPARGRAIGSGVVVGSGPTGTTDFIPIALRWAAGSAVLEPIGVPQGLQGTVGDAVTADGSAVVGTTIGPGGFTREQAYIYENDDFAPLADDPSGADAVVASGSARVAGGWVNPGQELVSGAVWTALGQSVSEVTLSGAAWSQVTAVDAAGNAAGVAAGARGPEAFIFASGSPAVDRIDDGAVADRSLAFGLNSHGDVVGLYEVGEERVAFVWNERLGLIDLNTLLAPADAAAWRLTQARAINDSRQIAGFGWYDDGDGEQQRAFRLTLPPPAGCAADRNGNGVADNGDILDFLTASEVGNVTTDLDLDGASTFFDLIAFLQLHDACN
jgi:hypothetical protein